MNKQSILSIILVFSLTIGFSQTIRYVKVGGTGNGSAWNNASGNLQSMINASASGDAVWVAVGTYKPTNTADRTVSFSMKDGVNIYGSFAGIEANLSERTPSVRAANPTILSGDLNGDDALTGSGSTLSITNNSDNSQHVISNINNFNNVNKTGLLDGFTIIGGNATGASQDYGGGIYNYFFSPRLNNVIIKNNRANEFGGGMYSFGFGADISNVTFQTNSAQYGGGLYNNYASPSLSNVAFYGNNASNSGGGLYNENYGANLSNSVFQGNNAQSGGAVFNSRSNCTISNATIQGNTAQNGGGIFVALSTLTVNNSILWGNSSPFFNGTGAALTVANSDIQGNYTGTGNINQDPLFSNTANATGNDGVFGTTDDGLQLLPCSPALNLGNNAAITNNVTTDITGRSRIYNNGSVDMGAYELQSPPLSNLTTPATVLANNALKFDATKNNTVAVSNCGATALINGGNALTIEYWFKGSSLQSAVRFQLDNSAYVVAGWNGKHILSNDGGLTGIKVSPTTGASATDGNWHHIAMTWQQGATNGFISYLDGQIVEQQNASSTPLPTINNVYLGSYNGNSEFMNGSLDDVRVWNVARTQSQIQAGMNNCSFNGTQTGLQVYYKFDHGVAEGSNSGINTLANYAATGANNNGQLINFDLSGTTSNWTTGSVTLPTRVYVKANASGNNSGLNWDNAFNDLQSALNYSCSSLLTEIWVAKGTYKPTTTGNRNVYFVMKAGVKIYGSFAGNETSLSERTPSVRAANPTILSGDLSGNDVITGSGSTLSINNNGDNSYHVIYNDNNGLTAINALLDGFMITGGSGSNYGGGMYNYYAAPSINNITFYGNSANYSGAGIYNLYSDVRLNNVIICQNFSVYNGAGIYNHLCNPRLTNATVYGNKTQIGTGGIYNEYANLTLQNTIIWGNTIGMNTNNATIVVTNTDSQDGIIAGAGNISQDPLFVNTANLAGTDGVFGTADDGLQLSLCSPALNAGDNGVVLDNTATDIVGNPRVYNLGIIDMGAYEAQMSLLPPPITTNNALNFDGANDYVDITNCTGIPLSISDALTIEYWFKGTHLQSPVRFQAYGDANTFIVAGWTNGNANNTPFHILTNDGGLNGIKVANSAADIYNNGWHHIAMTWQKGGFFTSYFDGVQIEQRAASNNDLPAFNANLFLGSYGGVSEFMNGSLDEVRVWNVVRTQAEIEANRLGCTSIAGQTGLLMYYQFNHGTASGSNGSVSVVSNSANANTFPVILKNFALNNGSSNFIASPLCTDAYIWTGAASTDWNNVSNWSPTIVPSSTSSLTIPITANKLTLTANQTGNVVTLSGNGKIISGNYNLTLNNLTGGSPTAYIVTNGTGSLTLKDIGITTTLFPVGPSETVYAPATITNTVNRDFTVRVGTTITNAAALTKTVNLQWDITPSVSSGNLATLALGWSTGSQNNAFNPNAAVEIAHYNGSAWDRFYLATVNGTNPYTATVTGVNTFSPFVVANQNALSVELLSFKGIPQYNGNFLTWETANEVNNKGFQIERITDNGQWIIRGFVAAKGKSADYQFTDNTPLPISYYRLRQIDNDGKEILSKTISIRMEGKQKLSVYPNPVSNLLTINALASDYQIINLLGQVIRHGKTPPSGVGELDVSTLPNGTYFLRMGTEQVRFVKQ